MLGVKNLSVKIEDKIILSDVSVDLDLGEVVAVVGPNGSGKSTLAYALMGHPRYQIPNSKFQETNKLQITKISIDGEDMVLMAAEERSKRGLFLVNQQPMVVSGLVVQSFLWQLYKKHNLGSRTTLVEFRKWLVDQANKIGFDSELLKRGLNDGFSGGEKKKLEILQLLVSNPKYVILDEVDSGLDIDALRKIATTVADLVSQKKVGVFLISHQAKIFEYLKPNRVMVLGGGEVTKVGGESLLKVIESRGFEANETDI